MSISAQYLSASEAARSLGVSTKALRLYERHGLVTPIRTGAGWRAYGAAQMARAAEIVAFRALGLGLAEIARFLAGEDLGPALAKHQVVLEAQIRRISMMVTKVRDLRTGSFRRPVTASVQQPAPQITIAFDLPWPWGGERFELRDIPALNYITGPLGSGKTRLAQCLAENVPNAAYLALDRSADGGVAARARLDTDPFLKLRVERTMALLVADGAEMSGALVALLGGLEVDGPSFLIVDMVEQGLDQSTQKALIAHLRRRTSRSRPLFLLTRSSTILDLAVVNHDEAIIFCPANHSMPVCVAPYPGAPGYEAVATCLATPEVRARTDGVIAWRPQVA
jgi:DNA-binding transcriptional MerR regulator